MEQTVIHDKRGMTLIEIMIALLLMAIVAVALMQSTLVVINNNVKNELRDAAVSVAEQRMTELRNDQWTDSELIAGVVTEPSITRDIRAVSAFPFTPVKTVTDINTNAKQVSLTISWTYRGRQYTHSVSTVLRNQ
jgi:prepilin-type N-terminal cleavage/methylation domain-containing protein